MPSTMYLNELGNRSAFATHTPNFLLFSTTFSPIPLQKLIPSASCRQNDKIDALSTLLSPSEALCSPLTTVAIAQR